MGKENKITFWQKLTFEEGVLMIVMIAFCISITVILAYSFLAPKGLARMFLDTIFGLFSGGYIYSLWKQKRRKG